MTALLRQSLRFGAVGLLNTAVGLLAIYSLLYFLDADPGVANAVGYAIGLSISFALNRIWTFADRAPVARVLPRFLLAAGFCYLLNLAIVLAGVHLFDANVYLIQLLGVCAYTVSMFLVTRWFVFRDGALAQSVSRP